MVPTGRPAGHADGAQGPGRGWGALRSPQYTSDIQLVKVSAPQCPEINTQKRLVVSCPEATACREVIAPGGGKGTEMGSVRGGGAAPHTEGLPTLVLAVPLRALGLQGRWPGRSER